MTDHIFGSQQSGLSRWKRRSTESLAVGWFGFRAAFGTDPFPMG